MKRKLRWLEHQLKTLFERSIERLLGVELSLEVIVQKLAVSAERNAWREPGLPPRLPEGYVLRMNPGDVGRLLSRYPDLENELGLGLGYFAVENGYQVDGLLRIRLQPDAQIGPGRLEVDSSPRMVSPDERLSSSPPGDAITPGSLQRGSGADPAAEAPTVGGSAQSVATDGDPAC